ncbi:MAG: antibiotic biosynthesis monooxygenase [Thioalkalispiraceae bacterium]|jgi:heme-degrading monooxygenase HmoA
MFAVIFRARINRLDQDYHDTARKLRDLAIKQYGCLDFFSVFEDDREIAISYWPNEEAIKQWKNDPIHRQAQAEGRGKWYLSYKVEICEIVHDYDFMV